MPGLRAQREPAVVGDQPAARAQAVAVERRAERAAVAEGERRRAVPGLHACGSGSGRSRRARRDVVAALVGLRDHHHHRVRQRPAGEREQLERAVEGGRVGGRLAGSAAGRSSSPGSGRVAERRLARPHPVDVAERRVDLAVVGDHPQRLRQLPARERVGREARVDDREAAAQRRVAQVGVELRRAAARSACPCRRSSARRSSGTRPRRRTRSRPGGGSGTGRRSKSSWSATVSAPAPISSCMIVGAASRPILPAALGSTGTSRQRDRPVAVLGDELLEPALQDLGAGPAPAGRSRRRRRARRAAAARPRACRPPARAGGRSRGQSPMRIPAPSPVLSSAPAAPRCSSRSSAISPRAITSWLGVVVEPRDGGDAAGVAGPVGIVDAAGEARARQLADPRGTGRLVRLGLGEAVGHFRILA